MRIAGVPFLLPALAVLAACDGSGKSADEALTSQEYAVYGSVIDALFLDSVTAKSFDLVYKTTPMLIVIQAETQLGPGISIHPVATEDFLLQRMPLLEHAFFRHFLVKNREPVTLDESRFEISVPVLLVPPDSARAIIGPSGDWMAYYARYPDSQGVLRLSRVAFSDDNSHAFVYVQNTREVLDAAGYYLLLERKRGRWVIVAHVLAWVE